MSRGVGSTRLDTHVTTSTTVSAVPHVVRLSVDLRSGGIPPTRGTVYRQPSDQPPNRSLPSKKNLNRFFLEFRRNNVNIDYVKGSSNSLYRIALN